MYSKTNIDYNNLDNLTINCLSISLLSMTMITRNKYSKSFLNNKLKNCIKSQLFYRVSGAQLKRLPTGH